MSKIYTNTAYVCSCHTSKISAADSSANSRNHLFIQNHTFPVCKLPDLYVCPTCQSLKCNLCLVPKFESKFCPSCMADHSGSSSSTIHCTKNCFDCPRCSSHMVITSKTIESKSKQFKFACTYCDYSYTTGVIDKPKSLLNILKSEYFEQEKLEGQAFLQYQKKLKSIVALNKLEASESRTKTSTTSRKLSPEVLNRLNALNLNKLAKNTDHLSQIEKLEQQIISVKPVPFDEEEDRKKIESRASLTDLSSSISIHQLSKNHLFKQLPNPKQLIVKKSFSCKKCERTILQPEPSPISLKFPIKWNAVEILPTIKVEAQNFPGEVKSGGVLNNLIICLMNPHTDKSIVSVTTLAQVPKQFLGGIASRATLNVSLSGKTAVMLAPKSETKKDSILKSIPTVFLTQETQASKAEKMLRIGRESQVHSAGDHANTSTISNTSMDDSFEESFDTSALESDLSWASVQMKLAFTGEVGESLTVNIPLHVSVETHLEGKPIKFKYWVVASLGNVKVVS